MGGVERLPRRDHFTDQRGHGLRTTWHADEGLVILSTWEGDRCIASFRLAKEDIPRLTGFLVDALADAAGSAQPSTPIDDSAAVNGD